MEYSKEHLRFVCETCRRNKMTAAQAHEFIATAWGTDSVSFRTIQRWFKEFTEGRTSLQEMSRCGRPRSSRTEENMEIVENYLSEWPSSSVDDIAHATGLPASSVHRILKEDLGLEWRLAKWVPYHLNVNQKNERVIEAKKFLEFLKNESSERKLVFIDEKIIYHRTIGTKKSNAQWLPHDVTPPKIPRRTQFEAKSMIIVAITFTGKHFVHLIPRGETVTSKTYIDFLVSMHHNFRRHKEPLEWVDMVIVHDNARVHTSKETQEFFKKKSLSTLRQPPHSPDMNLCDRFVFSLIENRRREYNLNDEEDVKTFATEVISSITSDMLSHQLQKLFDDLQAVIDSGGDYL
jgi:transposase